MKKLVAILLLLAIGLPAWAHGSLQATTPRADAVLDRSPGEIRLQFSEPLEANFSSIKLSDAQGKEITGEKPQVDRADPKTLSLSLPPLPSGAYRVRWSIVTRDGHKAKGEYGYTVK
jgi:methionine-rich copper-binding protein CopC